MSSEKPQMTTTAQINPWQRATLKRLLQGGFRTYAPGENLKSLERLGLISLTRPIRRTNITAVEITESGRDVAAQEQVP